MNVSTKQQTVVNSHTSSTLLLCGLASVGLFKAVQQPAGARSRHRDMTQNLVGASGLHVKAGPGF